MTKTKVFFLLFFVIAALFLVLSGVAVWYFFLSPPIEKTETNSNQPVNQVSNVQPTPKPKGERNPKLQQDADALLTLFDKMPQVPILLVNEPIQKGEEGKDGGVAYNVCVNKNPTIYVKREFYDKGNRKQIVNILKHELTHAYFCRQGIQAGHDERFRKKFTQVGGFGN